MVDKERRTRKRRVEDVSVDHCVGCETVTELTDRVQRLEEEREADMLLQKETLDTLMEELKAIRAQNETQLDIMAAWNNAKGFVKSVQTIGNVMAWAAKIAAVITALWAAIHYGGNK